MELSKCSCYQHLGLIRVAQIRARSQARAICAGVAPASVAGIDHPEAGAMRSAVDLSASSFPHFTVTQGDRIRAALQAEAPAVAVSRVHLSGG